MNVAYQKIIFTLLYKVSRACSSVVERCVDIVEVASSILAMPTILYLALRNS